MRALRAR